MIKEEKIYKPVRSPSTVAAPKAKAIPSVLKCKNQLAQAAAFTVRPKDWQKNPSGLHSATIAIPAVTGKALRKGKILVFLEGSTRKVALPFVFRQASHPVLFNVSCATRHLTLMADCRKIAVGLFYVFNFTVVVVTPNGLALAESAGINWKNFEQVCLACNIAVKGNGGGKNRRYSIA